MPDGAGVDRDGNGVVGRRIAFIGLGTMGSPMALNLAVAGCRVRVYDKAEKAVEAFMAKVQAEKGSVDENLTDRRVETADSAADAARMADVVFTSLPSSDVAVSVLESLLTQVEANQIYVDLGTTVAREVRRLAESFRDRGAYLLDAPVSGGGDGAAKGQLHIFAGGDRAAFSRVQPLLNVLGRPEHVVYCGESGHGQVVKGVNQLAMGLPTAAYLEAIAYGVRAGVDADTIARAVGGSGGFRAEVAKFARHVEDGTATKLTIKFPEFAYFLDEAEAKGFPMPQLQALFDFLNPCERRERDNMGRPEPSLWYELYHRR